MLKPMGGVRATSHADAAATVAASAMPRGAILAGGRRTKPGAAHFERRWSARYVYAHARAAGASLDGVSVRGERD